MGLTRRLLAAALALGLGGASAPATAAAGGPRPLAGVRTWAVYCGSAPDATGPLARFDVVVLEPNGHPRCRRSSATARWC